MLLQRVSSIHMTCLGNQGGEADLFAHGFPTIAGKPKGGHPWRHGCWRSPQAPGQQVIVQEFAAVSIQQFPELILSSVMDVGWLQPNNYGCSLMYILCSAICWTLDSWL